VEPAGVGAPLGIPGGVHLHAAPHSLGVAAFMVFGSGGWVDLDDGGVPGGGLWTVDVVLVCGGLVAGAEDVAATVPGAVEG